MCDNCYDQGLPWDDTEINDGTALADMMVMFMIQQDTRILGDIRKGLQKQQDAYKDEDSEGHVPNYIPI